MNDQANNAMNRKPKAPFPISCIRAAFNYEPETGVVRWALFAGNATPGSIAGSRRKSGYINVAFKRKNMLAHRLIWALSYGEWPSVQIDHINGDHGDNRLCNLRLATQSQNIANIGARSGSRSGLKGVSPTKNGKWTAQIRLNGGSCKRIGVYTDKFAALAAYNAAAREAHGEFAKLSEVPV